MGGNLFKLGRLARAQYLEIEAEITAYLDRAVGPEHHRIPRYYGDKPDFGDLDVIVSEAACTPSWDALRERILEDLQITRFQPTGAVFSTVYRDFQVDYFVRSEKVFLSTYHFLSYNDLGNLLGKIFRRMGLKYGERGLHYVFRRESDPHYKRDLEVSLDFPRTLAFIGLEYNRWEQGFDSLDDLFSWVITSPWFSVEPYRGEHSRTLRKRAKARPTIQKFLAWLDAEAIEKTCDYGEKTSHIERIAEAFPEAELRGQLEKERVREAQAMELKRKFSGKRVMALIPGLEGKALGAFIQAFKASFDDFEAEIVAMSSDEVDARIRALFKQLQAP